MPGRSAIAVAMAWLFLLVVTPARADRDPPESKVYHAVLIEGLERFPEQRFFVLASSASVQRVQTGQPVWVQRHSPRIALWSVSSASPRADDAIDPEWLFKAISDEQTAGVARATLEGYASYKHADSPATHLLTVYELKAVDGRRLIVERKRVETYESPDGFGPKDHPFAWYVRAHAAQELPPAAQVEPAGDGWISPARWPIAAAGVSVLAIAAALLWRARRRPA